MEDGRQSPLWMANKDEGVSSAAGEGHREEPFPGLNKAHGFFNLIERNQRDRDNYHQEREEWRQACKEKVEKELRNEKDSRRRPALPLYQPPHQRTSRGSRTTTPVAQSGTLGSSNSSSSRQQPRPGVAAISSGGGAST